MKRLAKLGALAGVLGAFFAACSSATQNNTGSGTNGTGGAGVGAAGSTGSQTQSTGTGQGGTGNNIGFGGNFTTGTGGAGTGGTMECAGVTSKAELIPLDIYLMLDSSGSMTDTTGANGTGPSKWDAITQALSTFFGDPASAGLGVGLQHFPVLAAGVPASCSSNAQCPGTTGPCLLKTCAGLGSIVPCSKNADCFAYGSTSCVNLGTCGNLYCAPPGGTCSNNNLPCTAVTSSFCVNQDSCTSGDYATPKVEIAPLNGAAGALDTAIMGIVPGGSTPTAPALQGAIDHAKAWAAANPTHEVVVLFATDGLPTECMPTDIPSIAQLAAAGASGAPSIKTFAIGVFAPADLQAGAQMNLDQIAAAGGTTSAFIVDTSQNNVEQAFLMALNAIRGQKLACEYQVPAPGDAGALDYGKVNVQYTPSGASMPSTIGYVGKQASCDPMNGGWYYDIDPMMGGTPTKIIMCPATCDTFGKDMGGQVDIEVGCQTIVQPPPK